MANPIAQLEAVGDVAREENGPVILCVVHDVTAGGARADDGTRCPTKNLSISLAHVKTVASLLGDGKYG